jgi:putative ABC transport system permease protein
LDHSRLARLRPWIAARSGRLLSRLNRLAGRDLAELWAMSVDALSRYRLRTALSVLGIVLGVAAVIAMMSVSEGARRDALEQMALLGLDNIVVRNRGLPAGQDPNHTSRGLVASDGEKIQRLVPLVAAVAPLCERYLSVSGPTGRKRYMRVLGTMPSHRTILRLNVTRGRHLTPLDGYRQARVCLLGAQLGRALFGYREAVGAGIRIDGQWYTVVGVLTDRARDSRGMGALAGRDLNQTVLVPLPTLLGRSLDLDPRQRVDELWVHLVDGERVLEVGRVVEHTLLRVHRGLPDFEVVVPRELLNQRYRTQRTFSIVVGSIAAISLLVGGIGVMNIMLASVLERTHEIGIRRTVGATRRDVTWQFLTESLLMTVSGGTVGIVLEALTSWSIALYAHWSTRLSPMAVFLALTVSLLVGLAFGIYPARKAACLDPIEALRYE